MLYINQLGYTDLRYPTDADHPESAAFTSGTIKTSGCGLCCAAMLADRLTDLSLSLEEAVALSAAVHADREPGTDMKRLGPALCERLGLIMTVSDDPADLIACLQSGGAAIINVGGDREGHKGVFSHVGHFMLAIAYAQGVLRILDPSMTKEKYAGTAVRIEGNSIYATPELITADTANRTPAFYLFKNAL